jgi:hypothetical protein
MRVGADAHEQIAKKGKGIDALDLCNGALGRTAMANRTGKESVGSGGLQKSENRTPLHQESGSQA